MIEPPFALRFRSMNRDQAKAYFQWFLEQIPSRITVLERAVRSTEGADYLIWEADESSGSLDLLGQWFAQQVEVREMMAEEIEDIYVRAPEWFRSVSIQDWELTDRTLSLAMDIGMYLGAAFLRHLPGLHWEMLAKPKNAADFQQPVLAGFGELKCNPVRLAIVLAYGLADRTYRPTRLRELFEVWSGYM